MARLGHLNEHGLELVDKDGDRLIVQPVLKPNLVLVSIPGDTHLSVALNEEQVRALVEHLQRELANRC